MTTYRKAFIDGLDKLKRLVHRQTGALLMETTVSIVVFALVGTAVLTGASIVSTSGAETERQSVAENIGRNQMEYSAAQPYQAAPFNYLAVPVPAGYAVQALAVEAIAGDPNIQKIIVIITFDGNELLTLETYRTDSQL